VTAQARAVWALQRRSFNEILRVPMAALPGVLAPTIFMVGFSAVFGKAAGLPGYPTDSFLAFCIGLGFLQGAGFTGAATGVNLARDIEQGWFDRMLVAPLPRSVLLLSITGSAAARSMLPATMLLTVGLIAGVPFPGLRGLAVIVVITAGFAATAACWGTIVALRFKTQQAAPLMQTGAFVACLLTTAYAPAVLLAGWLHTAAQINPVTRLLEGNRQGFVGDVRWTTTWHAMVALAGVLLFFGALALRSLRRTGL
jgi:ABC-2 type transport system permease protein